MVLDISEILRLHACRVEDILGLSKFFIDFEKEKHQLVLRESSSSCKEFQFTAGKFDVYPNGKNLGGLKTQLLSSCKIRLPGVSRKKKTGAAKQEDF